MTHASSELAIELGDVSQYLCSCCGRTSQTVHGFLYDKTGETTVYFAGYTPGHPEVRANMVLSEGGWGEGMTPDDRRAIALRVESSGVNLKVSFPPAHESPWYGEAFLGSMRSPDELSQEEKRRYEAMARIAVDKDPRVAEYFGTPTEAEQ